MVKVVVSGKISRKASKTDLLELLRMYSDLSNQVPQQQQQQQHRKSQTLITKRGNYWKEILDNLLIPKSLLLRRSNH
jgi:alkyl hydroperoxide reductase subunit AhpF